MNTVDTVVGTFHERLRARSLLERLLLKRNPLDYRAYVETFRESLIDANPHQVEAIVFALEKLENGGCILADEVGLGKTIEAGLVISQYHAQRRFNILIIVWPGSGTANCTNCFIFRPASLPLQINAN